MNYSMTYYDDTRDDGSVIRKPGRRWRALADLRMDLTPSAEWSVEKQAFTNLVGDPAKGTVRVKEWIVQLRAGEEITLPAELDNAIEQRVCREPGCRLAMRCRNLSHRSDVIGGLAGGRLVRVDPDPSVFPAKLHPSIDPASPSAVARPVASDAAEGDSRLLERARQVRASRGGAS
jgi:hypothetical protein